MELRLAICLRPSLLLSLVRGAYLVSTCTSSATAFADVMLKWGEEI